MTDEEPRPAGIPDDWVPCRCRRMSNGEWDCAGAALTVIAVGPGPSRTWRTVSHTPRRTACDNCRTCPGWQPAARERGTARET